MSIRIITVEREYGSGGAAIAQLLANRLGWKLWDRDLTAEIATVARVDQRAAQRCDERVDNLLYRLFKVYARGSYERSLPVAERTTLIRITWSPLCTTSSKTSLRAASASSWAAAPPIFFATAATPSTFSPTPRSTKKSAASNRSANPKRKRCSSSSEIDRERASFIRHYFNAEWPNRSLYNLMINTKFGDEFVVETVLQQMAALEKLDAPESATA